MNVIRLFFGSQRRDNIEAMEELDKLGVYYMTLRDDLPDSHPRLDSPMGYYEGVGGIRAFVKEYEPICK